MDIAKIRKKAKKKKGRTAKSQETSRQEKEPRESVTEGKADTIRQERSGVAAESVPAESPHVVSAPVDKTSYGEGAPDPPMAESSVEVPEERVEILCFQLGTEMYALHMEDLQEIIRPFLITPVPRTPSYVTGITSLRGKMVPVLNLKARLNISSDIETVSSSDPELAKRGFTRKGKIIIVKGSRGPIGVMADRIVGVKRLPESAFKPSPSHITEEEARFIESVAIHEERFITVLRTEESLGFESKQVSANS